MPSRHRQSPRPINYSVLHWMIFGASIALNIVIVLTITLALIFGES